MDFGSLMPKKPNKGMSFGSFMSKKRRQLMLREKFFQKNGAFLLKDKLKDGVGPIKIFGVEELEKATMNFSDNMIIGRGGQGLVCKGVLPDKRVVAIKRSKISNEVQVEQFINEIVILGEINHRNMVRLLGCFLETEIPLVAYEFVSNGTLFPHIHNKTRGAGLSWNIRLKIAHESASALAYLHSGARRTIIHRDVKSANILLDENYTAKVADFGASKPVPLGNDHVSTLVFGTVGYVDPEYFYESRLTDKSDVYSFGVVLAELITGLKPIDSERGEECKNLATYFLTAGRKNRLHEIYDRQVLEEATHEQLEAACYLVHKCLYMPSRSRPSMTEVTRELERIRRFNKHPWGSQDNCDQMDSLVIESEQVYLNDIPLRETFTM